MFLPNLQKNIQELERQISRLETECEHMGRREITPPIPPTLKPTVKESTNQPFITGPSISTTTYSAKMMGTSDPVGLAKIPRGHLSPGDLQNVRYNESPKPPEKKSKTTCEDGRVEPRSSPRKNPDGDEKRNDRELKTLCRRSIQSIREVSESSDETFSHLGSTAKGRKPKEVPKEPTWCELLAETSSSKSSYKTKLKEPKEPVLVARKGSSDEENCRRGHVGGKAPTEKECESETTTRGKRRSRSARTKKNFPESHPVDGIGNKSLQEKEIQCLLWNEEKGKGEFFLNVHESVRILQGLIEDLKKKTSQEKRNDVLNDMQNTLRKITGIRELTTPRESPPQLKQTSIKLPEGAENITNMKNALYAVKKICEDLSNEKTALTEEISAKNVALANLKTKEKEYVALISSLKYNLEKVKEAAEEGNRAKRELKILTVKLQEEAKVGAGGPNSFREQVIEALKKSHEKMQALVENYVLENDKLKAHVKIVKLETQKYNVLLAGKETEITKYKREIESFQKQITEQLSLLRSRATETEVQQTIEAISNQANILQKDDQTTQQDGDETLESSSMKTQSTRRNKEHFGTPKRGWEYESKHSASSNEKRGAETARRPQTQNQSSPTGKQFDFVDLLPNSTNLRDSIDELLQDIKRESSDVYWLSAPNSCLTSARSTSAFTTSEEVSDISPKD